MTTTTLHPSLPDSPELVEPLLRRLGYGEKRPAPAHVLDHSKKALTHVLKAARPQGVLWYGPVTSVSDGMIRCEGLFMESVLWANLAKEAEKPLFLAVFALTLGSLPDSQEHRSVSQAYFIHEAGSVVIEKTADLFTLKLEKEKREEALQASFRFSPGYCDIPLHAQTTIFHKIQPEKAGINLHESGAMSPLKSLTAALLFSPRLPAPSPCAFCRNIRCAHRRG